MGSAADNATNSADARGQFLPPLLAHGSSFTFEQLRSGGRPRVFTQ